VFLYQIFNCSILIFYHSRNFLYYKFILTPISYLFLFLNHFFTDSWSKSNRTAVRFWKNRVYFILLFEIFSLRTQSKTLWCCKLTLSNLLRSLCCYCWLFWSNLRWRAICNRFWWLFLCFNADWMIIYWILFSFLLWIWFYIWGSNRFFGRFNRLNWSINLFDNRWLLLNLFRLIFIHWRLNGLIFHRFECPSRNTFVPLS